LIQDERKSFSSSVVFSAPGGRNRREVPCTIGKKPNSEKPTTPAAITEVRRNSLRACALRLPDRAFLPLALVAVFLSLIT